MILKHAKNLTRKMSDIELTFAVVYARLSVSFKIFFNSRNRKCPPVSLLRNFVYLFVSKCSIKTLKKRVSQLSVVARPETIFLYVRDSFTSNSPKMLRQQNGVKNFARKVRLRSNISSTRFLVAYRHSTKTFRDLKETLFSSQRRRNVCTCRGRGYSRIKIPGFAYFYTRRAGLCIAYIMILNQSEKFQRVYPKDK